ncbi:MAG: hypothetical protein GX254_00785 [Clostridiales bacterium]|jgi:hypothetical protein|nr:hypothetical protein [Clostridiales bacterium]
MAKEIYEIYQRRRPLKIFLKIMLSIIIIAIVFAVVVFFWFQSYIVYTPEGIRLDIPFLSSDDVPAAAGRPAAASGQD